MTLRHQFSNDAVCVVVDADPLLRTRWLVGSSESCFDGFHLRGIRSKRARLERGDFHARLARLDRRSPVGCDETIFYLLDEIRFTVPIEHLRVRGRAHL